MANPRRSSYSNNTESPFQLQNHSRLSSIRHFLKKPLAFPFLLSIFLLLAWISLRLQHSSSSLSSSNLPEIKSTQEEDEKANLIKFKSGLLSSKDKRGWLLDPVSIALEYGIKEEDLVAAAVTGGAVSCFSIHVGEIKPGGVRGNHRHHTCNETIVIWGAKTLFRLENNQIVDKGYAEVIVSADEVAVAASPSGTAHAIVNMDRTHTVYLLGCQDSAINNNSSATDFSVWKDL
ncbi:hypothetical protein SADUNF_Sadunf06G0018000 [Salix dunnii]|uniref:Capsular polysaccharide assembling protein CapF C-terminal domain-containing protein n=1 Tax=Salix dunnii TaxID=1413687 RepID=A0A835K2L1_9ROSI|nr:hypothetical protein SADUNF_Sadunf06G0018000 [Salix dunnii]